MQQKELQELVNNDGVKGVLAVNRGDHFNVTVEEDNGDFSIIRVARGGKREFKTLDAVKTMLDEVGVKSFHVC